MPRSVSTKLKGRPRLPGTASSYEFVILSSIYGGKGNRRYVSLHAQTVYLLRSC